MDLIRKPSRGQNNREFGRMGLESWLSRFLLSSALDALAEDPRSVPSTHIGHLTTTYIYSSR